MTPKDPFFLGSHALVQAFPLEGRLDLETLLTARIQ